MHHISMALVEHKIGLLRFDFTGLGNSGGEFENSGFRANLSDLQSALDFMSERGYSPQIMFGHSLGGTAVLAMAHKVPSLKLVATIGSPFQPAHSKHLFGEALCALETQQSTKVTLANREFTVTREFVKELDDHDMDAAIHAIDASLLLFHDPEDEIVESSNAKMIYEAARHPKSFISLPGAGHLLNVDKKDPIYVATVIAATARSLRIGT